MPDSGPDGVVGRVKRLINPDDSGPTADAFEAGSLPDVAEGEALSATDFLMEIGMSREGYILALLRERGGCLRQQDLYDSLALSDSAVSRRLSRMEDDGIVDRCYVDGGKIVTVPDYGDG